MDKRIWLVICVAMFVLMIVMIIGSSIKSAAKRKIELERYKKMTGRAEGKILSIRTEEYRCHNRDGEDDIDYKTFVTYQFEVDGKLYKGSGEGSGAFWQKKKQMICYNPEDPTDNCTKYYHGMKTGGLGAFIVVILFVLLVVGGSVFAYLKVNGIV